ncbi:AfsR/SARP family transcriptional regulator [Lentzea kentuckyensis]|uniref:AfsR/SARP family transcriptional regulator n=1 Tax=Lentzea kentuckyensis TaxID=360086 RepID=UPI001302C4DA|nr:AfsR/SARP family transcriptional regulator [Lentzea kentuckyensis]
MAASEREPQRAIESLRAALTLWRGDPFADVEVPVLAGWARGLAVQRLAAVEALYEAELACGLHEAVLGELTDLVREHPLRERLHGLLMTGLYRAGRRSEALEAYRRARQALVSELGLEPGPELHERARAHEGIGDAHAALSEHDRAAEHWQRALVLYRQFGLPQVDTVTAKLAGG